jgi:hypothetical protein
MERFFVTPVQDRGKPYWMASYPGERPRRGYARRRKQKKFAKREEAESFLLEAQREYVARGRVELAHDRQLHYDLMRAVKILADVPNGCLETAAHLLRMCRSAREFRGGTYEVPTCRQVELEPRTFLLCNNEARRCGILLGDMVNRIILMWLEHEVLGRVKERDQAEEQQKIEARRQAGREKYSKNYKPKRVRDREAMQRMFQELKEQNAARRAAAVEQEQRDGI